ncbi:hypothetical protein TrRE_jg7044 [Triparma retinervis]|uniref:25S rRNA adenine-N(1) methyltransferase n=1 Tax=Triparma retinervis TaxID=2557542 RepID=A0A9W7CJ66_9STRA|nr:hypothetical protein TrRE_jg7044 [Triparma retinervis]
MGKRRKPIPLVRPLKSRKLARTITTQFHVLTHARSALPLTATQELKEIDDKLEELGGRKSYQEASQLNTSVFSTSKWVVGRLGAMGILEGKVVSEATSKATKKSKKPHRRPISVLEVGCINTQLQDASRKPGVRMSVRSIDLRSTSSLVEVADFNALPPSLESCRYDAIVCSMVINCVPTPAERGEMLLRLRNFTKIGGVVFLMLPLLCVNRSKYLDKPGFTAMLEDLKFEVREVKETPKILFYTLVKEEGEIVIKGKWRKVKERKGGGGGKKYTGNEFAVCFEEGGEEVKKRKRQEREGKFENGEGR